MSIFKTSKTKSPSLYKEIDHQKEIHQLERLLSLVGDNQKDLLYKELTSLRREEDREERIITNIKNNFHDTCLILPDITLVDEENKSHRIDFLLLTKKACFLLETRKLFGDIMIDEQGTFSLIKKNTKGLVYSKKNFFSPIRQNEINQNLLNKLFQEKNIQYPIYHLVVVTNATSIINITNAPIEIKERLLNYKNLSSHLTNLLSASNLMEKDENELMKIANILIENDHPEERNYVEELNLELVGLEERDIIDAVRETGFIDDEIISKSLNNDAIINLLKQYRRDKAKELGYEPYFIFNDAQLSDIINTLPKTYEDLENIHGFGKKKVELYGLDILKVIYGPDYMPVTRMTKDKLSASEKESLQERLRKYRLTKSRELQIKPYEIYTNEKMMLLVNLFPSSLDDIRIILADTKNIDTYLEDIDSILNEYR